MTGIETTELYIVRLGDRTTCIGSCSVVRQDDGKHMFLTALNGMSCPPRGGTVLHVVVLKGSLMDDQFPPLVAVSMTAEDIFGKKEISYFVGYICDMHIMSDANKMLVIEVGENAINAVV